MRSYRTLLLMAFGAAFCIYLFVWCLELTVSGGLPDQSTSRLFGMAVIMAGLLLLGLVFTLSLRSRVIIGEDGLEIVHAFRRERLPWDEITGVWVRAESISYDVMVRTPEKEHNVLSVPVRPVGLPLPAERFDVPPPKAPRRLRKQYGWLREAWERHRTGHGQGVA
ncbi:hypothetical protein GCM10023085_64770 [Actinomadura viridis]|uniref:Low molecular weight protein antigen 6 PH domain-containing protein n=1 Tax=Actinomadura viridis TaxID=58110 RepID=A0A931DSL5_9ACTN|nr:PH domain-containing protein [Actinomadura viridis]MBG6093106.1 hypothetical protein [Actinomadura viridis]